MCVTNYIDEGQISFFVYTWLCSKTIRKRKKKRHGIALRSTLLVSEPCHCTLAHWQGLLIHLKGTQLSLMLLIKTLYVVGTAPETSLKTKNDALNLEKHVLCCRLLAHRLCHSLLVQNGSRFEIVHTIELVHSMEGGSVLPDCSKLFSTPDANQSITSRWNRWIEFTKDWEKLREISGVTRWLKREERKTLFCYAKLCLFCLYSNFLLFLLNTRFLLLMPQSISN